LQAQTRKKPKRRCYTSRVVTHEILRSERETYESLDVEKEHSDNAMAGPIELEEIDQSVLEKVYK
jgi:hypothetical protein